MLAKLTSKNQLTLPKQAITALCNLMHFDVVIEGDRLVLTPTCPAAAAAVRRKLSELGLTDADVTDAVPWARRDR